MTEIKHKTESEKKILKYINSLPQGEWVDYTVAEVSKKLKLSPTTVKLRLMLLEAIGMIELDNHYKTKPLIRRIK